MLLPGRQQLLVKLISLPVGDQPGLIADDSVELDPQFRKTAVLYRTNEVPGTIIVVTARSGWQTADAAVYAGVMAGLFGTSALYHRGR